jgi:DNA polymerase-3 subunit gamma/tau
MENFIVSARKYRPATFASVVGQNHITSTLRNAISRGQLAHAYLFCGPRGVGKTTCARIFAKAINCQNPKGVGTDNFEACNECESCRGFDEGRSFNIHELDAASNNSVDDIRNLTDQVRIPPQVGRYSVYIIDEVHMLSASAFNAFLKTLEEPPAHAVFILATTEKHKIIPTILSRCQIFDFNRIRVADGVDYMKHIAATEGVTYDEESLNLIARKADGGMRDALSMFDKAVSFCGSDLKYKEVATSLNILDYDTYFDAVDVVLRGDYGASLVLFDRVLAQGFSGQTFMAGLGSHLRDLLVGKNPATAGLLDVTGPLMERYTEQAARCGVEFLFDAIALLTDLDARVRSATNQRLMVELALMKLCSLASPAGAGSGVAGFGAEKKKAFSERLAPEVSLPDFRKNLADGGGASTTSPARGAGTPPSRGGESPTATAQSAKTPLHVKEGWQPPAVADGVVAANADGVVEKPKPNPQPPKTSISGRSLSEIMNSTPTAKEQKIEQPTAPVDPDAGEKIERHRDKFLERLSRERPRIGVAFETMETNDNTVRVRVASKTLHDEIMRFRTETLHLLAAVAGVHGPIELEVVIDETVKPARAIRLEDRVKHLSDLNPEFNTLRKTFEMEIE